MGYSCRYIQLQLRHNRSCYSRSASATSWDLISLLEFLSVLNVGLLFLFGSQIRCFQLLLQPEKVGVAVAAVAGASISATFGNCLKALKTEEGAVGRS